MMMKVFLVFVLIFSTIAFADDLETVANDGDLRIRRKLWVFPAFHLGFSSLATSISGEESKSGVGVGIELDVEQYWRHWVAEAGLGYWYKSISGTRPNGLEASLQTRSLYLLLGGEYRITQKISSGILLQAHFGGDLSHRPTIDPIVLDEPSQGLIFETGLQCRYHFYVQETPMRIGIRVLTDLDVPNRRLFELTAFLQVGLPLANRINIQRSEERPTGITIVKGDVTEVKLLRILFEPNSSDFSPKVRLLFEQLAGILATRTDRYESLDIEGHTDREGVDTYNQRLSEERARKVSEVFFSRGVQRAKVNVRAYGYSQPVTEGALDERKRNRRVVIRVTGVPKEDPLADELRTIVGGAGNN